MACGKHVDCALYDPAHALAARYDAIVPFIARGTSHCSGAHEHLFKSLLAYLLLETNLVAQKGSVVDAGCSQCLGHECHL